MNRGNIILAIKDADRSKFFFSSYLSRILVMGIKPGLAKCDVFQHDTRHLVSQH